MSAVTKTLKNNLSHKPPTQNQTNKPWDTNSTLTLDVSDDENPKKQPTHHYKNTQQPNNPFTLKPSPQTPHRLSEN